MAACKSQSRSTLQRDPLQQLAAHPLFRDLDGSIASRLASLGAVRPVRKGSVLYRKGEIGSSLYTLLSGAVRLSAPSKTHKDAILTLIFPGELFGELAALDGGRRISDAVAIENSEVAVIESRDLLPLVQAHPDLAIRLIQVLCSHLRRVSEQVEDILFLDLPHRLAKILLYLHNHAPIAGSGEAVNVTQFQISQMVGATRQATNRHLRNFQKLKIIGIERATITIRRPEALLHLVQEVWSTY